MSMDEKESVTVPENQEEVEGETNDKAKAIPIEDENIVAEEKPLYFSKSGKPQFGVTAPTAFALKCPYPPLPSNLSKNRVLRPQDEQSKESLQEGIIEAEKVFETEAMPLPGLSHVQGSPLKKMLIPEIELAIYWDRHPYEFRPGSGFGVDINNKSQNGGKDGSNNGGSGSRIASLRRSKSDFNLMSQVGEILEEKNSSRRSSLSNPGPLKNSHSQASSVSIASTPTKNVRDNHQQSQSPNVRNNSGSVSSGKSRGSGNSEKSLSNGTVAGKLSSGNNHNQLMQMRESERKKFEDIKRHHIHHHHVRQYVNNPTVENKPSEQSQQRQQSRPKLIRSKEQVQQQLDTPRKSAGVQVTLEEVTNAALKSTYLCPLHGQYRKGVERRDKGGFRTDMSSRSNTHSNCSRALKGVPSRTKLIKSAETQTDEDDELPTTVNNAEKNFDLRTKRSKTAMLARNLNSKIKDVMASEYHGSFRNPYRIAESEKRHLRNKILNYCFSKHSIF